MSVFRCEFKLDGNGDMPTSRDAFNKALGEPHRHYSANPYCFEMSLMANHFCIDIDWPDATEASVRRDIETVAGYYNKSIENFKITPR